MGEGISVVVHANRPFGPAVTIHEQGSFINIKFAERVSMFLNYDKTKEETPVSITKDFCEAITGAVEKEQIRVSKEKLKIRE